jgi:hypothetical protein
LNGWKEIGAYLGKSARTVQRWEKTLGLPVHRLAAGPGESVFAFQAELDDWRAQQRARPGPPAPGSVGPQDGAAPGFTTDSPSNENGADAGVPDSRGNESRWKRAGTVAALAIICLFLALLAACPRTSWSRAANASLSRKAQA